MSHSNRFWQLLLACRHIHHRTRRPQDLPYIAKKDVAYAYRVAAAVWPDVVPPLTSVNAITVKMGGTGRQGFTNKKRCRAGGRKNRELERVLVGVGDAPRCRCRAILIEEVFYF